MRKSKPNMAVVILLLICILLLGGIIALLSYTIKGGETDIIYKVLMYVGIALAVLVLFTLFAYLIASRKSGNSSGKKSKRDEDDEEEPAEPTRRPSKQAAKDSRKAKRPAKRPEPREEVLEESRPEPRQKERRPKNNLQTKRQAEVMPDVELSLDGDTVYNGSSASYIPSVDVAQAKAGRVQSLDEKFEQIGKMGKSQFVVYMAKLFGLKGYKVSLAPVTNNHGIDMTVEKMGVLIAVGCVQSNKLLGEADVRKVEEGKQFYGADRAMVVTNQYFDRAASAYGQAHDTSLVDRTVMAEDFMR